MKKDIQNIDYIQKLLKRNIFFIQLITWVFINIFPKYSIRSENNKHDYQFKIIN